MANHFIPKPMRRGKFPVEHKAWVASAALKDVFRGAAGAYEWKLRAFDLHGSVDRFKLQAPRWPDLGRLRRHDV